MLIVKKNEEGDRAHGRQRKGLIAAAPSIEIRGRSKAGAIDASAMVPTVLEPEVREEMIIHDKDKLTSQTPQGDLSIPSTERSHRTSTNPKEAGRDRLRFRGLRRRHLLSWLPRGCGPGGGWRGADCCAKCRRWVLSSS